MNVLKKQLVKRNYHKETLKITIDMAWPAIVESFFVAFAGLIDSLMVSSLGSYAVAAVGLTTQPKLLGLAARCRQYEDHHADQRNFQYDQYYFKLPADQRSFWFSATRYPRCSSCYRIRNRSCLHHERCLYFPKRQFFKYSLYYRAAYPSNRHCVSQPDQSRLQCLF